MKNSDGMRHARSLIITCVVILVVASMPMLSRARTNTASVRVVNNSNRVIRNLYLSHVDLDDWGADQLADDASISSGQSFTIANAACDQAQVKVIAEDQEGCFLTAVVDCGDATWTITNQTAADCGNGD